MPKSLSMICVDSHTTSSSSTMSTGKSMNSSYTLSSSSAIFRNTVAVNVEPLPSSLSTSISPFIMRAAESAIGMPSPVPCCSTTSLRSARENASNTCGRYSLLMPMPLSFTVKSYWRDFRTASVLLFQCDIDRATFRRVFGSRCSPGWCRFAAGAHGRRSLLRERYPSRE